MKKSFTTISMFLTLNLPFVFCQSGDMESNPVVVDKETEFIWNSDSQSWTKSAYLTYEYDGNSRLAEILKKDIVTDTPVSLIKYQYNDDIGTTGYEVYSWSVTKGVWIGSTKYIFRYENTRKIGQIVQNWNGSSWVNNKNDSSYVYNENGLLVENTNYKWKNNKWIRDYIIKYEYNESSLMTAKISINLYGQFLSRVNYSYTPFGKYLTMSAEFWRNNQWEYSWNREYKYDNCGILKNISRQSWSNNAWVNTTRSEFDYKLSVYENSKKIPVCHNGHTIFISINALKAHLAHGDCIGYCSSENKKTETNFPSELIKEASFSVFPNPAKDYLTVRFSTYNEFRKDSNIRIELTDYFGKIIKTFNVKGDGDFIINTQNLIIGKYFLRMNEGENVFSIMVIKE